MHENIYISHTYIYICVCVCVHVCKYIYIDILICYLLCLLLASASLHTHTFCIYKLRYQTPLGQIFDSCNISVTCNLAPKSFTIVVNTNIFFGMWLKDFLEWDTCRKETTIIKKLTYTLRRFFAVYDTVVQFRKYRNFYLFHWLIGQMKSSILCQVLLLSDANIWQHILLKSKNLVWFLLQF